MAGPTGPVPPGLHVELGLGELVYVICLHTLSFRNYNILYTNFTQKTSCYSMYFPVMDQGVRLQILKTGFTGMLGRWSWSS